MKQGDLLTRRFRRIHVREDPIQTAIVRSFGYMGRTDVQLIHPPNELADTDSKRIRQARLGLWPGCPDLIFVTPHPEPLVFIECKATGRNVAAIGDQASARVRIESLGHRWALINSPQEILPTLDALGLLRLRWQTGGL